MRNFYAEMLEKVAFLIPQNNANPALNGLLLEISQHGSNNDNNRWPLFSTSAYTNSHLARRKKMVASAARNF